MTPAPLKDGTPRRLCPLMKDGCWVEVYWGETLPCTKDYVGELLAMNFQVSGRRKVYPTPEEAMKGEGGVYQ